MFEIKGFTPRNYQNSILETAKQANTLIILPTGLGKTAVAILLAVHELNKNPESKILITAPTKPLVAQLCREFQNKTNIEKEKINLLTGAVAQNKRENLWINSIIIGATPQTIQKSLEKNLLNLNSVSLLIIDECHRSRMRYATTILAKDFKNKILALTASPGNTKEKIEEICQNLSIENIEIRTEQDEDIQEHIQKKSTENILVELPEEFSELQKLLKDVKNEKLMDLKKVGFTKPTYLISKKDLILLQNRFRQEITRKSFVAFYGISLVSQILKLDHALDLLETQGLNQLREYFEKMKTETSKASKVILNNEKIKKAMQVTEDLSKKFKHPKIHKLKEIIFTELTINPESKIIVFANFRNTVNDIVNELKSLNNVRPIFLLGQKEGITQKQQIQTIKNFEDNTFNVLVCTSIGEEGLDIKGGAKLAIFYDSVPSEIRNIQRKGRVGRLEAGRIIFLMTKDSRDIAYFWTSKRKEVKMRNIITQIKNKKEKQLKL
ncbi:MAG: DEAD/DEAH box helicase [Nanoarchaeota archaeon]